MGACWHFGKIRTVGMLARSSSVRGISTATENMTDQPFEFLLPIIKIADGVVVLVHRLLCFWKMDRQQEAYNIILPGR